MASLPVLALALLCAPLATTAYTAPKTLEKTWTVEFELAPGEIYNEWIDLPMPDGKFVIESFNADIVVRRPFLKQYFPYQLLANNGPRTK